MAGEATTTLNSELFAPLVTAAQYAAYENAIARSITTVYDAPMNAGKVLQVPVWASITAATPSEGSAPSFANTNTTSASITLSEIVVAHRVTDLLRDSAYNDVMAQLGDQSGRAIAEGIDAQVFSLFSSFSEGGPGANTAITVDYILKAVASLRSNKLQGPFYAVLNPKQAYAIKKELASNGGSVINSLSQVGETVMATGYIGQVAGVQIFENGGITIDGSGDAVGAVFHPMAIGHAMRGTISMEQQRQAAYRATDVVLTGVAGAAILNSNFGLKLTSDATFGTA